MSELRDLITRPAAGRGALALLACCSIAALAACGSSSTGTASVPAATVTTTNAPASNTPVSGTPVPGTPVPGTPVPGTTTGSPRVTSAPTQVAATSDGHVAYRELGSGPPLVLITGLSATMNDWSPGFVDSLAASHRVIELDNAGVGQTSAVAPLTITAMATQTSALLTTLHIERASVLGWSMGGMVAQALAVGHPGQVGRLVLAATQPGTGKALPVPPAAAAALLSPNGLTKLGVLFPANQTAAGLAYAQSIFSYPDQYQVSSALINAQGVAVRQWIAGDDPAGRNIGTLRIPTLVADGDQDRLNPVANDRMLTSAIPGAKLVTYPDAGHAFLFQDEASFLPRLQAFLAAAGG
jgi:pimeloyl-ACP methyl ester carboxylesterase